MALQSSKVAVGVKVLAEHLNKLWDDLVTNHDHSTGQGGAVDHVNLASKGTKTHSDIDIHIKGSGSITDNPGGNKGVHGLAASAFPVGNLGNAQLVFFQGEYSGLPSDNQTIYFSAGGTSPAEIAFDTAPKVYLQVHGNTGSSLKHKTIVEPDVIGTTTFTIRTNHNTGSVTGIQFLAIGTKT